FVESSFQADWTQSPYSSQVPSEVSGIEVDPIGNKVNAYHPWKKWTIPTPLARGYPFGSGNQYGKYSWGVSPRFVPYQGHKPISSYFYNVEADPMGLMYAQVLQGSAPEPIYTATYSIAGIEIQYGNASNQYVKWNLPQTISPRVVLPQELQGEIELNYLSPWQITNGKFITNAVERMRARAFAVALEAAGAWV
ncbi:Ni Fe-hydrogenase I large subunit, partial [Sulfolobus sp. F3]